MATKLIVKDINLLPYVKAKTTFSMRNRIAGAALIALGAVLLVLIALFVLYNIEVGRTRNRMVQLEEELYNAEAIQVFADLQAELDALILDSDRAAAIKGVLEQMESVAVCSLADYQKLFDLAGERIWIEESAYSAQENMISIKAGSDDAMAISAFVEKLRASGLFREINYTGYEGGRGMYAFALDCALKEGGRDV